jgi:hypothetical protein
MARRPADGSKTDPLTDILLSESELAELSPGVLVDRLVARGISRLTAERFVEIQRGTGEPGRARSHPVSRR